MSESKFCMKCGKKIPINATFCPICGATQETTSATEGQNQNTDAPEKNNQPKRPERDNMWTALKLGVQQTFTWSQRISRPQYWWLYLDLVLISFILNITLGTKIYSDPLQTGILHTILLLIYSALSTWISVMQFTAGVRRLHDTNRSAHYLWLALIPIVGPILLIVFLCQKPKEAGKRFDHLSGQSKPWVQKWWTWCILVLATAVFAGVIGFSTYTMSLANYSTTTTTSSDDSYDDSDDDSDDEDTDSEDDDTDSESSSDTDSITIDDDKINLADQQAYTTSFSDSSWAGSTFKIDKVTVYKTDGTYTNGEGSDKQEFNGIVKVHMSIHAGRDISAYPTQAKLSTNDGQQVDADFDSDDFDGDLNSGTNADGNLYFILPKLSSIKDLTSIRLKWDSSYDTDDYDDDNDFKTFDATINLN